MKSHAAGVVSCDYGCDEQLESCALIVFVHVVPQLLAEQVPFGNEILAGQLLAALCKDYSSSAIALTTIADSPCNLLAP